MPGCCIKNCKNSGRKGFRLFRIPRNENRQNVWLNLIQRDDVQNANSFRVCEVHFSESQFHTVQKRGSRALKLNAVPDLLLVESTTGENSIQTSHKESATNTTYEEDAANSANAEDTPQTAFREVTLNEVLPTVESCEPESDIQQLQRKLKSALKKIKQLDAKVLALESGIQNIFNEDQLLFIHNGSVKGFSWSEHTLQKALRLYMLGYNTFHFSFKI